ncbi:protein transporter tim10 [Schaereria dolodes]|nr:protein transporter tim10 [Schaereria dolodes]
MSFLFGGRPQLSSAEKISAAETEVEMLSETFSRVSKSCTKKCIPPEYREGDLNKGESVCLDRCISKFFDVNLKISEKMQNDAAGAQNLAGGTGFGM